LCASVLMGAACGELDETGSGWLALTRYGQAMGLAFQIVDDILDATQPSDTLGKTAGKDADANKPTYVSLLGLQGARAEAADLLDQALTALSDSGLAPARWAALASLAQRIVHRHH
jgi:farnesyl diphosphate synthase